MSVWPQITFIAIAVVGLGSTLSKGKGIGITLIANAITFGLLYAGGFWAPLGLTP